MVNSVRRQQNKGRSLRQQIIDAKGKKASKRGRDEESEGLSYVVQEERQADVADSAETEGRDAQPAVKCSDGWADGIKTGRAGRNKPKSR